MTDEQIKKASQNESNTSSEKIKAIYPHITVSGDVDKPYYNIDWYDIEKQTMYRGYSSYNLQLVCKWLQENFEVVEDDIDNLINRYETEIERLKESLTNATENYESQQVVVGDYRELVHQKCEELKTAKTEAVKEFAKLLIDKSENGVVFSAEIPDFVKEWVGDNND